MPETIEIYYNREHFFDNLPDMANVDRFTTLRNWEARVIADIETSYPDVEITIDTHAQRADRVVVDGDECHSEDERIRQLMLDALAGAPNIWAEKASV